MALYLNNDLEYQEDDYFDFDGFDVSGGADCDPLSPAVPAFLAALVQCFDWAVPLPQGTPLDMEEAEGLVSARKQPLVLVPTQRLQPFPLPAAAALA